MAWSVNGGCCGRPGRENIDDVGFINAVVGDVANNVDGCAPPASTTDGAITTSTAGCPDDRNVVLVTVDGGDTSGPRSPLRDCGTSSPLTAPKVPEYYSHCAAVGKM